MLMTRLVLLLALWSVAAAALAAQRSNPAVVAPPTWSRLLNMPDGRTFVSDGGLAIDVAIAKPATLPSTVVPQQGVATVAGLLQASYDREVGLTELLPGPKPNTFAAPKGPVLNGNYITFLQSHLPAAAVRLRIKGATDPVVIVHDGRVVGILMPVVT